MTEHNADSVRKIIWRNGFAGGHLTKVWVGLGAAPAGEDSTMPEVTHSYVTKRALLAAIENGSAFLQQIDRSGSES